MLIVHYVACYLSVDRHLFTPIEKNYWYTIGVHLEDITDTEPVIEQFKIQN